MTLPAMTLRDRTDISRYAADEKDQRRRADSAYEVAAPYLRGANDARVKWQLAAIAALLEGADLDEVMAEADWPADRYAFVRSARSLDSLEPSGLPPEPPAREIGSQPRLCQPLCDRVLEREPRSRREAAARAPRARRASLEWREHLRTRLRAGDLCVRGDGSQAWARARG